jgi:NAD dependent epimerase/dehydratase family enzyme
MEIVPAVTQRALRIVLPGGSGQIGQFLARYFQERGHHVTVLTRGPYTAPWQTVHWDGEDSGDWIETLEGADACINLSGRSVNCRYHADNRADNLQFAHSHHATAQSSDYLTRSSATSVAERICRIDLQTHPGRIQNRSASR